MNINTHTMTGAFLASNALDFDAAAHAMAVMVITGEIVAEKAAGFGSLQMPFLDALYNLKKADIDFRLKCSKGISSS